MAPPRPRACAAARQDGAAGGVSAALAGRVRGPRDPPPSASWGRPGGIGLSPGCHRDLTGLSRPQAEAADPAGAGELAEEEEGVPGHQGHPGQAGAAQQAQGTVGPGRAWSCSPGSSSRAGNRMSLKFLGDDPSGRAPQGGGPPAPQVGRDLSGFRGELESPSVISVCRWAL